MSSDRDKFDGFAYSFSSGLHLAATVKQKTQKAQANLAAGWQAHRFSSHGSYRPTRHANFFSDL